jgi:hypothetical protein
MTYALPTIVIHPMDDDAAAQRRQAQVIARLEYYGVDQVDLLMRTGGLPTNWDPIIHAWLKAKGAEPD